jgi:group I intron endonuclease
MNKLYCITNKINDKKYIGFTSRPIEERIAEHFAPSSYKSGYAIHKAIKKYGKDNFEYCVLYEGPDALEKEDSFIKMIDCKYNMTDGGNLPPNQLGKTWKLTDKTKQKMSEAFKGKPKSEKHKKSMSECRKGKSPWNKGLTGVQECPWKGQRNSPMTSSWKITKNDTINIIRNLALWCDENGYNKNTVKTHLYKNSWPYKDIEKIEKVNNG